MIPSEITTHIQDALNRLLEQYKEKPNIQSIIEIYSEKAQELEPVFQELFYNRLNIDTAIGQQLDEIGYMINEPRLGLNDEDYRKSIKVRIGINTSEGTSEDIISIFKLITSSVHVHLINIGFAEMDLEGTSSFPDQNAVNQVFADMNEVRAGGARINEIRCVDETEAFGFAGSGPAYEGFTEGYFSTPYRFALPFAFASETGEEDDPATRGFGAGHADPFVGGAFIS